jgi:hypothetical protein
MVCSFDQRRAQRANIDWPVSVWHRQAGQFFNGRGINVSATGALIELPLRIPVQPGQAIELNFPRQGALASEKGVCARIKAARVVRVDRGEVLKGVAVRVGVEFPGQDETL